jgi:hypothetical protein
VEENTALTEEAKQRYATTKSRLTNLKYTTLLFAQQLRRLNRPSRA